MSLVEEDVRDPGGEEAQPADGEDDPDLGLCQLVRDAIHINQPHVGGHAAQGGDCQPA